MSGMPDPNELDDAVEVAVGRRAPFTQLGDWLLLSGASMGARTLYWALSAHISVSRDDTEVWPSLNTLARILGVKKPDNLTPYLLELEVLGAVDVIRSVGGLRSRNRYIVHQTPPPGYRGAFSLGEWHRANRAPRHETAAERKAREATFDASLEAVQQALKEHCAAVAAERAAARKTRRPLPPTHLFAAPSPGAPRTPTSGGTGIAPRPRKNAGRNVPPPPGVRTPGGGGLVPPPPGVEQDEVEPQQSPLSHEPQQPSTPSIPARNRKRGEKLAPATGSKTVSGSDAAAMAVVKAYATAAEQLGSPTTEKILQALHDEAKELLASRADQHFVAHLARLASELPGQGWQRLTPHLLHNPLPRQNAHASGLSRAELIAACTVCDEYGQIEMANGSVANCRHGQNDQRAA